MQEIDLFKQKFIEESMENVSDLEEALFLLENDNTNIDIIERIFRAMHSLKGGGAMFGFNELSDFTHHLETIYDKVRNNLLTVDENIISTTFKAVDQIKHLLNIDDLDEDEKQQLESFKQELIAIVNDDNSKEENKHIELNKQEDTTGVKTYFVDFKPHADIFANGTNVLFLLDDIASLGKVDVFYDNQKVPELSDFDPTNCYVNWKIVVSTEEQLNELQDIFIFVEDECDLNIKAIYNGDLLNEDYYIQYSKELKEKDAVVDYNQLKKLIEDNKSKKPIKTDKKVQYLTAEKISSIRVASNKIDELVNNVSELVTIQAQLQLFAENSEDSKIIVLSENIEKLTRQLRDIAFSVSLIPLQNDMMRFRRLVRDLSKDLNKQIEFVVEGGDIELDKNIIEHLGDPLLHMIRNCIDHGIETPDERISKGKNPTGTIILKAYYQGSNVIIKIIDDGKGIEPDKIFERAVEKGIVEENSDMSRKQIFDLVFVSGFSMKDNVSEISGRGVGMDVVKRKINEIRGEVSIDSVVDEGTTVTIELPLTLSIIDGLVVSVGENKYVIPIAVIEKLLLMTPEINNSIFNNVATIEGEQLPVINLKDVFNIDKNENSTENIIKVKHDEGYVGLIIDEIVGEYQTVVKPLSKVLRNDQYGISGASVMGDGSLSLVLDINRLINNNLKEKIQK